MLKSSFRYKLLFHANEGDEPNQGADKQCNIARSSACDMSIGPGGWGGDFHVKGREK